MGHLRIEHGLILPMEPPGVAIPDGVVVVENGEITYVGAAGGAPPGDGADVIDATGCLVTPGLINAHTHVSMTLFRGYADDLKLEQWLGEKIWPAEMQLRREDVYWGAMLGIVEMIRGGVTTFNDMYHYFDAVADAAADAGIRACVSGVLIGVIPGAEELFQQAVEFTGALKQRGHPLLVPMLAPHAPYSCPDDLLVRTAEAAAELGVRLHIHVAETASEVSDSLAEHGATPVGHLHQIGFFDVPTVACHCVHLTDEDIAILAEHQVGIAHCPTSNMKLASGFARVADLLRAGACLGLGTDGAASNNNLDMFEEMMVGAVIAKGHTGNPEVVSADEMLAMATRGSAAALGLDVKIGTLVPGKRADIIVVDTWRPHLQPLHNPVSQLVYAARADDVRDVIIEGTVVMRDRQLTTVDEAEIIAKAREAAMRLVGS
ncbi:MAG: amidohydrolase [Armatimonadetes bacterium]|nr:amidohydrolase [Armatimonadota bacterium]